MNKVISHADAAMSREVLVSSSQHLLSGKLKVPQNACGIERGGFEVGVRPEGFQPLASRFERLANRIVLGVIAAAFINGLAVLVSVYRPPGWERWAWAVFAFGFLCALVLGIYLAWSIDRSGRG